MPIRTLAGLSVAVLFAHLLLLRYLPLAIDPDPFQHTRAFTTRILKIEPAAPVPAEPPVPAPAPAPRKVERPPPKVVPSREPTQAMAARTLEAAPTNAPQQKPAPAEPEVPAAPAPATVASMPALADATALAAATAEAQTMAPAAPTEAAASTVQSAAGAAAAATGVDAAAAVPAGTKASAATSATALASSASAPIALAARTPASSPASTSATAQAARSAASQALIAGPLPKDTAQVARTYAVPGSMRLEFEAKGLSRRIKYEALPNLIWRHDGNSYEARTEVSAFLLGSRVFSSRGHISADGLVPDRFSDKFRSERAAHFERDKGLITFSANSPSATLLPGAQDRLSVFIQLASIVGGDPLHFGPGATISIQTVGPTSADTWEFTVEGEEKQYLPGGTLDTIKLTRNPRKPFDQKVEIWLAPQLSYMPARMRITDANGDFLDQQWKSTQAP